MVSVDNLALMRQVCDIMNLLLGVNIDHIATLRQARYALLPDSPNAEPSVLDAVADAKLGGADSITIHVRGDRRHMQEEDAYRIKEVTDLPINLEMGNSEEMIDIAMKLKPKFICLVPETREEVTTEGGLDVVGLYGELEPTVKRLQAAGMEISMFIDPDVEQVEASARLGAEMVELHTGCFANAVGGDSFKRSEELERLKVAAVRGNDLGIQVNAGHGINYDNILELYAVPYLKELNIGHTIVARSVRVGFKQAVSDMRDLMEGYDPEGALV